ncbi:FkbM family methyltransferase [Sphingobium sp. AN558]|uniref:FkbM family methyltransferase n=1 Tax=Sphingobium sp. AN558 TaxID=3133442 RepID=UPI0030C4FBBB
MAGVENVEAVLKEADAFCVNGTAKLYGFEQDEYFRQILQNPGLDVAFHNPLFSQVAAALPGNATIIDIGANIGLTTIPSSRYLPQGRVISIEPSPKIFSALAKMTSANGLKNVTLVNKCIGEVAGQVPFVENFDFLAGSYAGSDAREESTVMVEMITLDSLVRSERLDRIDLIKIDVEGFELDVLKGGSFTLDNYNPIFVMEFNSFALTANRNLSPRALLDFILDRFGSFSVLRQGEKYRISTARAVRDFIYANMAMYGCVEDIVFGNETLISEISA